MYEPHTETLAARLRRDATEALPGPPEHLTADVQRALHAARREPPSAPRPDAARTRARALAPWVALAAGLLIAVVTWLPTEPTRHARAEPTAAQGRAGQPLQPLLAVVLDDPLLTEWENLTRDARGSARYLLERLGRPLLELRSLATTPAR